MYGLITSTTPSHHWSGKNPLHVLAPSMIWEQPPGAELLESVSDMLVPKHKGESENKDLQECCGTKFHSVGRGGFSVRLGEGWELPSQVTEWLTTRWGFQSRKKIHFVHSSPSPFQFSCSHKGIKGPSSPNCPCHTGCSFFQIRKYILCNT